MKRVLKWTWPAVVVLGLLWLAAHGFEAKEPDKKDTAKLYDSLRQVINSGAKIFNENGDHAGCFRLYEGALLSIRPYLEGDLQKELDTSLTRAGRMASYPDKAFELRRVLDLIRDRNREKTKDAPDKGAKDKTTDKVEVKDKDLKDKDKLKDKTADKDKLEGKDKKTDKVEIKDKKDKAPLKDDQKDKKEKAPEGKDKNKKEEPAQKGEVKGRVTYAGKAVGPGTVLFLPADGGKDATAIIQGDGTYGVVSLAQTKYLLGIKAKGLPSRYEGPKTSGLTFRVSPGSQEFNLELSDPAKTEGPKDKDAKDKDKKVDLKDKGAKDKAGKDKAEGKDKDKGIGVKDKEDMPEVIEKVALRASVHGKVTLDGAPLPSGAVVFWSLEAKSAYKGMVFKDGTFEIPELPAGEYRILVQPLKKDDGLIPLIYRSDAKTPLTFRAAAGANTYDIDLKAKK